MVPTRTGKTGKPGKWKGISSQGILSRLGKSGNFSQNRGKSEKIILENLKESWKCQGNLSTSNGEIPANMVPYLKKKKTNF